MLSILVTPANGNVLTRVRTFIYNLRRDGGLLTVIERFTSRRSVLIVIVLLFVIGAVTLAESRPPHGDEGHFASGAWEFAHKGRLAFPMLTEFIPSLDRYMYEGMPLYFIQLGLVSILTGYEIDALRMDSVVWGVVLILSCYFLVAGLTRDRLTAALTLILLACRISCVQAWQWPASRAMSGGASAT